MLFFVFFFKQKTAYEMRISDWSSDVCSSDLSLGGLTNSFIGRLLFSQDRMGVGGWSPGAVFGLSAAKGASLVPVPAKSNVPLATHGTDIIFVIRRITKDVAHGCEICARSEEHTSELQSLMRISYAVFCL